jgi:hypothetical protein
LTPLYAHAHNAFDLMTFDEQLGRAFDTISGLIRAEVSRQVHAVSDELAAARLGVVARESEAATARLVESIRAIGSARSLSEVLDALVTCAGLEASRAGVLLVRGDRFHGWRFIGFGDAFDGTDAIEIARHDAGVITQAVDTMTIGIGGLEGRPAAPRFAQLPARRSCIAVPLAVGGQAVAVLYADAGGVAPEAGTPGAEPNPEPGTLNTDALEVLTRYAARTLEAFTVIQAARSLVVVPGLPSSAHTK